MAYLMGFPAEGSPEADTRARFGFAYFDVANPTERGLAKSRDPRSGALMRDLHAFLYNEERVLKPSLLARLRAEEKINPLLRKLDPRMSQVVALGASPLEDPAMGAKTRFAVLTGLLGAAAGWYSETNDAKKPNTSLLFGVLGAVAGFVAASNAKGVIGSSQTLS